MLGAYVGGGEVEGEWVEGQMFLLCLPGFLHVHVSHSNVLPLLLGRLRGITLLEVWSEILQNNSAASGHHDAGRPRLPERVHLLD